MPYTYVNGRTTDTRSSGVRLRYSMMDRVLATTFRCRSTAPRGAPVDPEVYTITAGSSGPVDETDGAVELASASSSGPTTGTPDGHEGASPVPADTSTTNRRDGTSPAAAARDPLARESPISADAVQSPSIRVMVPGSF